MTNVILLRDLYNKGSAGEEVEVRPGFARNYLIPSGRAVRATEANRRKFEGQRAEIAKAEQRRLARARETATALEAVTLPVVMAATSMGTLYGSVSPKLIAREAGRMGYDLSPSDIVMVQPIRSVGVHPVKVRLHPEVEVYLRVAIGQSLAEISRLGADGSTAEERQDRALRLLDTMAAHLVSDDVDDVTEDLLTVAALADEEAGIAARAAIRRNAGRDFAGIVRNALDSLDIDCLVGVDATVDLHDKRVVHFRARLLGALPTRVGDLRSVRLVEPGALAESRLELSLHGASLVDFSEQVRNDVATSGDLVGIEIGQTVTIPPSPDDNARRIWAMATLNGECVHRQVWSF